VASGVLVIAAMSTADASETVERLVALVPPHRQAAVRTGLGVALRAVVCQRLAPGPDGTGRRPEVRMVSGADRLGALALTAGAGGYGEEAGPDPLVEECSRPDAIAVGSPTATSR